MYQLNKDEQRDMNDILKKQYMLPIIQSLEDFVKTQLDEKQGWKLAFNQIYSLMREAMPSVDVYLADRKTKGDIKDESQARKSIAGNAFPQSIVFIFLKNKMIGNINSTIFITSKKSKVPSFDKIATVYVDGETQKPDCDLIIYSLNADKMLKCIILSLKTSLRERAGQTYKWKLLMEIAISDNKIKEKYNITYNAEEIPLVCFATVNFYDEINNPQQRGMFKFFDKAFIAKDIDADFISKMSELPDYVNNIL